MRILIVMCIGLFLFSCSTNKSKTYQWRGENRSGIFPENKLLKKWPKEGPEELWFAEGIGDGYGTPAVTETEIYITGAIDSTATIFCLSLDGEMLWNAPFGKEWIKSYKGSRSQPTIVDDLIYIGSGMGNLFCLKRENGEIVWSKDFTADFAGIYPRFGHSEAALIDGDKVFWTPGGKEYNVVALNRFTGDLIWSNKGYSERSGYNPGTIIELPSRKIFVTFSAYHLMGLDAETGELLWSHVQDNYPIEKHEPGIGDTHSNCVIYDNGYIYYAAGDGLGGVKLKLSGNGTKITQVWRNKGFDSYMGGIVKINKHLFGSGTTKKQFKSINVETGELSDSLKIGWGAVIAADDMLYYYNQSGYLNLVSSKNGNMKKVSEFRITKGTNHHFAHPVIKDGILYQRRGQALMAFDIRNMD